jgi:hypothetical protein
VRCEELSLTIERLRSQLDGGSGTRTVSSSSTEAARSPPKVDADPRAARLGSRRVAAASPTRHHRLRAEDADSSAGARVGTAAEPPPADPPSASSVAVGPPPAAASPARRSPSAHEAAQLGAQLAAVRLELREARAHADEVSSASGEELSRARHESTQLAAQLRHATDRAAAAEAELERLRSELTSSAALASAERSETARRLDGAATAEAAAVAAQLEAASAKAAAAEAAAAQVSDGELRTARVLEVLEERLQALSASAAALTTADDVKASAEEAEQDCRRAVASAEGRLQLEHERFTQQIERLQFENEELRRATKAKSEKISALRQQLLEKAGAAL